jgi:hypothetical protein
MVIVSSDDGKNHLIFVLSGRVRYKFFRFFGLNEAYSVGGQPRRHLFSTSRIIGVNIDS